MRTTVRCAQRHEDRKGSHHAKDEDSTIQESRVEKTPHHPLFEDKGGSQGLEALLGQRRLDVGDLGAVYIIYAI